MNGSGGLSSNGGRYDEGTRVEESDRGRSTVLGAKGGAFATVVMTVFRMPVANSLPPTADFWARFVGDGGSEECPFPAFALHLLYGTLAGGLYGLLSAGSGRKARSEAGMEFRDLVKGALFSVCASVFGTRVVLKRVVGMDLDRDEALVFHVGHLVYGLSLGAWVGSNRE